MTTAKAFRSSEASALTIAVLLALLAVLVVPSSALDISKRGHHNTRRGHGASRNGSASAAVASMQSRQASLSSGSAQRNNQCAYDPAKNYTDRIPLTAIAASGERVSGFCTPPDVIRKLYQQMREMDEVFNKTGIEYFAIGGTLLGAIRHQGIIPWDDDSDVVVPIEQKKKIDNPKFRALIKQKYKMRLIPHDHFGFKLDYESDPIVGQHKYHYPFIDVFINIWRDGKSVFDGTLQWPEHAIKKDEVYPLKRHKFGDFEIWVPNKSEEYLTRVYPDWKTHGRLGKRHDLEKNDSDTPVPLDQLPSGPAQPIR